MIGRRMIAAGVVAGAVAVGGVAGAVIGIPGLSSASTTGSTGTSGASGTSGATGASGGSGATGPSFGRHDGHGHPFFGMRVGGDDGVLGAAAKDLGLTTPQLLQKLSDGKTTIADLAQQQNVDVQKIISDMEAVANQNIQNLVNNPLPAPPKFPGGFPKMGHGGIGFGFGFPGIGKALDPIAKALGISTDELQNDLKNGQSIADIAKSKNVSIDTIANAVVGEIESNLNQMVQDKKIPQDVVNKIESNLKERITDLLQNGMKGFGGGFGFRFHFGGKGGMGGMGGGPGGAPWPGSGPTGAHTSSATAA